MIYSIIIVILASSIVGYHTNVVVSTKSFELCPYRPIVRRTRVAKPSLMLRRPSLLRQSNSEHYGVWNQKDR